MNKNEYFETIKCDDFEIYNLEYHNKRVINTIGMNIDLNEYIYPISNKLLKCKITYNNYEVINVEYAEYKKRDIKTFKILYSDDIDYSKKYLDRSAIEELFSKKQKADEIMIFKNGLLTDTSIANIAIYNGTFWLTPKTPLLYGTSRQKLLDEKKLIEKDITLKMLKNATKIALLNAMIGFDEVEDYSLFL